MSNKIIRMIVTTIGMVIGSSIAFNGYDHSNYIEMVAGLAAYLYSAYKFNMPVWKKIT